MVSVKKKAAVDYTLRQRGLDYASDQPWFLLPDYLRGVEPKTRAFYQQFIDSYGSHWRAKLMEALKYSSLLCTLAESGAPNPFFAE